MTKKELYERSRRLEKEMSGLASVIVEQGKQLDRAVALLASIELEAIGSKILREAIEEFLHDHGQSC